MSKKQKEKIALLEWELDHYRKEYEIAHGRLTGNRHPMDNGIYVQAEVDEMMSRERELKNTGSWIPITKQLPELGKYVLVASTNSFEGDSKTFDRMFILVKDGRKYFWHADDWGDRDFDFVTHWMPLPKPPGMEVKMNC